MERKEIDIYMINECYSVALDIYKKKIGMGQAISQVIKNTNMNPLSAKIYIVAIIGMIKGECFENTIQILAIKKYVKYIENDFGINQGVSNALKAIKKHLDYLKKIKVDRPTIKQLSEWYEDEYIRRTKDIIPPKPLPGPSKPKVKIYEKDIVELLVNENERLNLYISPFKDEVVESFAKQKNIKGLTHYKIDSPLKIYIITKTEGSEFEYLDEKYKIIKIHKYK